MLRPNDQLRVQVYNEPSISGDYQVDSAGYISVPLAGRVKASGRTAGQLEQAIVAALSRGMLKDPRVNVQVSNYAAFYIHGEVKKSGEYPYRPGLTVMDAVATAGGFTYRADESKAVVRRAGDNVDSVVPLDRTISVSPGDNIKIPERFF
jgi:polysaccharide export outer membrane protein